MNGRILWPLLLLAWVPMAIPTSGGGEERASAPIAPPGAGDPARDTHLPEPLVQGIDPLIDTAQRAGIRLLELEVVADHAHLLVALAEGQTLPSVMHQLKGATARSIFLKYPELKSDLGHNSFWQKGYGFRRLSSGEVASVRRYMRTQAERPLRRH